MTPPTGQLLPGHLLPGHRLPGHLLSGPLFQKKLAVALVVALAVVLGGTAAAAPAASDGDLPGVRRADEWLLRSSLSSGRVDDTTVFARAGGVALVGDWDGDGIDDVGVWRDGLFLLDTDGRGGRAEVSFAYGRASDVPVVGDWDGDDGLAPGEIVGRGGPLFRYRVTVDSNTGVSLADFGRVVEAVLSDPRSWTAAGNVRLQHVTTGPAEIGIRLATPAAVDATCAPLRTIGYYSCTRGRQVVLNRDRWLGAVPFWTTGLAEYRRYLVNHEVGHALGHGHVGCPGPGRRAPVMQQQSISLQGCVENGWPFP